MQPVELTVEGTRVHAEHHPAQGRAKGAVVLLHGFNSGMVELGPLPAHLAAAGLHALAFDARGHGASGGERGRVGLDRALAETDAALAWLREHAGKKLPFALVGHSLGGTLALGVLSRRSVYRAAAVAHPLRSLMDEISTVERLGYHLLGRLARRRMAAGRPAGTAPYRVRTEDLFEDPGAIEQARREPFLQTRVNLANYDFAATMDGVQWAARVHVPVLCVEGPSDRVVAPAHTAAVRQALGGPVERLEHTGGHSCFLDRDGPRVSEGIAAFLVRRLETA